MTISLKLDGQNLSLAEISSAIIERKNAAADTLKLTFFDNIENIKSKVGSLIEVFEDNKRTFRGRASKAPQKTTATCRHVEILAKNAWDDLERIVYQQLWASANTESGEVVLTPVMRSKVVLGQNSSGNKINVAAQLRDILQYAISCGAEFQIGNIDANSEMLLDEAKDLSCAEAIARVLKWTPNTCAYFDYDIEGLPKLNVISRQNLPEFNIDSTSGKVAKISVTERPDLQVPCVCVKYEMENIKDDFSWITVQEDIYPTNALANIKNAIVMSVELAGTKQSCKLHEIECKTIQLDSIDWWKDKIGEYVNCKDLQIVNATRNYSQYPRELISGTICAEMNFKAQTDYITATIKYTDDNQSYIEKRVGIHTTVTNAVTGTYPVWTTSEVAEEKPEGLAQAIYQSVSSLQFEGAAAMFDCDSSTLMGKLINIKNGDAKWANMRSPAVSVSEDILKRTTTVYFGPSKHLYPDDIAELFRINRQRKVPANISARASGQTASANIKISGLSANTNSATVNTQYSRLVVSATEENSGIDLNAKNLGNGKKASFQELYICYRGNLAKAKFLTTSPETVY